MSRELLQKGVTTVFVNPDNGDSAFEDNWLITKDGKDIMISISYDEGKKRDSTLTGMDDDFYEWYSWVGNDSVDTVPKKFIKEKYKRTDDGTKLGKEYAKFRLDHAHYKFYIEGTSSYVKDTSMMIGDSMVNCIVTRMDANAFYETIIPIDSFNTPKRYQVVAYSAKGLGQVRTIGSYDQSIFRWDLKEIRPLRKNN